MRRLTLMTVAAMLAAWCAAGCGPAAAIDGATPDARAAERMISASRGALAPVYAPLAEQIVNDFDLAEAEGVGIDVGSGPGTLVVELARRTRMHWINADINAAFFPWFFGLVEQAGLTGRASAMLADARRLPFRCGYADVVVSRGSYPFWGDGDDRRQGFAEIYRVLKPGGVAYVGRGFSRTLPVETARSVRRKQGGKIGYDRGEAADELRRIMDDLGIRNYRVETPAPERAGDLNYGVWVEFHKPEADGE